MNFKDKKSKMIKLDKFFLNRKKKTQKTTKAKNSNEENTQNNNKEVNGNNNDDASQKEKNLKNNSKGKKNSLNNYDSNNSSKGSKKKLVEDQLIKFNDYKDLINNAKDFKCKFCLKSFNFHDFKEHYNICTKNPINSSVNKNTNQTDIENKDKSNKRLKIYSNSNTIFTSEKTNNSRSENDYNIDNLSSNKSTIKKFTLSNSSLNNIPVSINSSLPINKKIQKIILIIVK